MEANQHEVIKTDENKITQNKHKDEDNNNNSTIYRIYFGYSKTLPENTYHPEGTLPTP
jgi:uncharacterized protein (UPF0305 family)